MSQPTHIVLEYKSQNYTVLSRASDGIVIAMRKDKTVIFGESPNSRKSHVFMNTEYAEKWLRETYPARDLKDRTIEGEVELDVRDAEPVGIIMPESIEFDLPGNGLVGPGSMRRN